jgi:hypothetical protein
VYARATFGSQPPPTGYLGAMGRTGNLVIGVVVALLGILWILQGLNIVGSSGMSGHPIWAVIGAIFAALGLFLVFRSRQTPPGRDDR